MCQFRCAFKRFGGLAEDLLVSECVLEPAQQKCPVVLPCVCHTCQSECICLCAGRLFCRGNLFIQKADVIDGIVVKFIVVFKPANPLVAQEPAFGAPALIDFLEPVPECLHGLSGSSEPISAVIPHDLIGVGIHVPHQFLHVAIFRPVKRPVATDFGDMGYGSQFVVSPLQKIAHRVREVAETYERVAVGIGIQADRIGFLLPLPDQVQVVLEIDGDHDGNVLLKPETGHRRRRPVREGRNLLVRMGFGHLLGYLVDPVPIPFRYRVGRVRGSSESPAQVALAPAG